MSNTPKVQGDRQARAAAARKAAAAKERRRRLIATGIGVVVLVAVVAVLLVVGLRGKGSPSAKGNGGSSNGDGKVPTWPAPTGDQGLEAIHAAGLQAFGAETLTYHIHAHLDVVVDGSPVTVPPQIGFAYGSNGQPNALSSLHTHRPDGIIHIEAPKRANYTLGQFFKEWQVPLTRTCVGALCSNATHSLSFYVNGKQVTGDPDAIVLHAHDEIAVMYTSKGRTVTAPSSFDFPDGD
ncbi:MAG: hypothetical protein ACJ74O_12085 [Frankiaceae bacterium]